jgi:hypothetical protein
MFTIDEPTMRVPVTRTCMPSLKPSAIQLPAARVRRARRVAPPLTVMLIAACEVDGARLGDRHVELGREVRRWAQGSAR